MLKSSFKNLLNELQGYESIAWVTLCMQIPGMHVIIKIPVAACRDND